MKDEVKKLCVNWLKDKLFIKKPEPQGYNSPSITGHGNVVSIAQSGGITANNVTLIDQRPKPRQITNEQRNEFTNIAKLSDNNSCQVLVRVANTSDDEAVGYGRQLQEMLGNTPGWEAHYFGTSLSFCDPFPDIKVGVENISDPKVDKLISALKAVNIPFTTEKLPSGIRILVGSQHI